MPPDEPSGKTPSQDRNRGLGVFLIVGVIVIANMLAGEIGDRLGIPREAQTTSDQLIKHLWVIGFAAAPLALLFLLARLFQGSRFVREAFPGCESWECLGAGALLATIYAVLGAGWLIVVGDRFAVIPLILSFLSSLILAQFLPARRWRC